MMRCTYTTYNKLIKEENIIPCLEVDPLFFQAVQLHHSAPTASQLILEQNCGIKILLTKHAEAKVITANDKKQKL